MSEWSTDKSETRWSTDEPGVAGSNEASTDESSGPKSITAEGGIATTGRRFLQTLRWAVDTLRASPRLVVLAIAVSALTLFPAGGTLIRWAGSIFGVVLVTAASAVVAKDTIADRNHGIRTQSRAVLVALPGLMVTVLGFGMLFFVGADAHFRMLNR